MSDPATAALVLSGLSTATSTIQQSAAAKRQAAQVETQRRQQIEAIQQQQEIDERSRREKLRRDQAAQRARFAGRGISSETGSASSLLSSLARNVDQAIADQRSRNRLTINDVNTSASVDRGSLLAQSKNTAINGLLNVAQRGLNLFDRPSQFTGRNPFKGGTPPSVA